MDVSIDPTRPERAVFGSLEEGLIELKGRGCPSFGTPQFAAGLECELGQPRCPVPALDFDRQGNLWLLNEGTENP